MTYEINNGLPFPEAEGRRATGRQRKEFMKTLMEDINRRWSVPCLVRIAERCERERRGTARSLTSRDGYLDKNRCPYTEIFGTKETAGGSEGRLVGML